MKLYNKLDDVTVQEPVLLTEEQGLAVFNALIAGKSVVEVKHLLNIPTADIKRLENKLVGVREIMKRLVRGEEVSQEEVYHFDEETGEKIIDTPIKYYPKPTSMAKLKTAVLTAINSNPNYGMGEGLFQADSLESMIDGFNYVIEQMIVQSNVSNNASFSWWKSKVTE